jgi:2-polyprenyl-3-methyl-5-hydroxy-6-metoxy-1,4-benzoquinol methylase
MGTNNAMKGDLKNKGALDSQRQNTPDVRSLMSEIREKVKKAVGDNRDSRLPFIPQKADENSAERKAGELLHSEELRFLNQNHHYPLSSYRPDLITSHRPGVGKVIVKIKRKILSFFWQGLFKPYFEAEREYQSHLVRLLNDMTKYIDSRDAFIFWDLIKKIDYDVNKALERIEGIADTNAAALMSTERRVTDLANKAITDTNLLATSIKELQSQINTVDSVSRGIEGILNRSTAANKHLSPSELKIENAKLDAVKLPETDFSYLLLENRYRGSQEAISARMAFYPPFFKNAQGPILEIGGGRGELQLLLKESGVSSYSVDLDSGMVEAAKSQGVDARLGDGIAHLESLPDRSLGGVIACQVIEHLDQSTLKRLVQACAQKIKPGGKVIFETINTDSMVALTKNYFRDPTHVFPLHPETMRFMLDLCGLRVTEIHKLSPYSSEAELQEIQLNEFMTPRWAMAIETLNKNIRKLNSLMFGHQDYCIIAEV